MTVEQIKDFIDRVPIEASDISFALEDGDFDELRMSAMQFYYSDMVILNFEGEKVTIFRKRK